MSDEIQTDNSVWYTDAPWTFEVVGKTPLQ